MPWAYLFAANNDYPDPLQEIAELSAIEDQGQVPYLLLSSAAHPPMSLAAAGDLVYLCTRANGVWSVHGHATIAAGGGAFLDTPPSVLGLYGPLQNRWFHPLHGMQLHPAQTPAQAGIAQALPPVRACVISFGGAAPAQAQILANPQPQNLLPLQPRRLPIGVGGRRFAGVDLTAGTWVSHLNGGNPARPFPVVELVGNGDGSLTLGQVDECATLQELHQLNWAVGTDRLVIDGPCKTNGIPLLVPPTDWDYANAVPGFRLAEQQLAAMGVGLFWTTLPTLHGFDGASRWIARSVHLFAQLLQDPATANTCIETHPHAVFFLLHQVFGAGLLHPKTTPLGRAQRLAILNSFAPTLNGNQLPTHDHIDAAAAAMLGAMQWCGRAIALGDAAGGNIWIPDVGAL